MAPLAWPGASFELLDLKSPRRHRAGAFTGEFRELESVDNEILHKAIFLLRDCRESEERAVEVLKTYFPGLAHGDRERYVSEAWDVLHGVHAITS
jgi:hypothetical protein